MTAKTIPNLATHIRYIHFNIGSTISKPKILLTATYGSTDIWIITLYATDMDKSPSRTEIKTHLGNGNVWHIMTNLVIKNTN